MPEGFRLAETGKRNVRRVRTNAPSQTTGSIGPKGTCCQSKCLNPGESAH
jgi:hypothetical protein